MVIYRLQRHVEQQRKKRNQQHLLSYIHYLQYTKHSAAISIYLSIPFSQNKARKRLRGRINRVQQVLGLAQSLHRYGHRSHFRRISSPHYIAHKNQQTNRHDRHTRLEQGLITTHTLQEQWGLIIITLLGFRHPRRNLTIPHSQGQSLAR